ncbi:type III-A CRISPR-associated protein Csm2 [bacterium]|nr:type III-A CRISPR-associated protein Csm2 [bacterium]
MSFVEELKSSKDWLHDKNLITAMETETKNIVSSEKRTQLRKIFNQFISLIRQSKRDELSYRLQLLKARISYTKARNTIKDELYITFCAIIDKMSEDIPDNDNDFKKWLSDVRKFVEAFYAYGYVNAKNK